VERMGELRAARFDRNGIFDYVLEESDVGPKRPMRQHRWRKSSADPLLALFRKMRFNYRLAYKRSAVPIEHAISISQGTAKGPPNIRTSCEKIGSPRNV
jgi:hypothetical protein